MHEVPQFFALGQQVFSVLRSGLNFDRNPFGKGIEATAFAAHLTKLSIKTRAGFHPLAPQMERKIANFSRAFSVPLTSEVSVFQGYLAS